MAVQTEVHERSARRKTTERGRRAVAVVTAEALEDREDQEEREAATPVSARTMPRIVTVYRGAASGEFRHSRCDRELTFVGVRGGIEIDFYCLTCREHITLTEAALARVPVGQGS
jgi:hypothetical protein